MTELSEALAQARQRVDAAAVRSGRDPTDVDIVVVTKRHPVSVVAQVVQAGARCVGENFVQELMAKQSAMQGEAIDWHFIGRLQRNKTAGVVGRVTLIHTVDSIRLIDAIAKRAQAISVVQPVLLAVNVAGELHKSGCSVPEAPTLLAHAQASVGVRVDGLMTMPPLASQPEANRVHFAALCRLRDELATPACPLPVLSMGTSSDFEVAVEEGATLVRLGTVLLGPRQG